MNNQQPAVSKNPIKDYFATPAIQKAMEKMLGDNASSFITSVLQAVSDNSMLKDADPKTVFMASATAAALNLPINKQLGFAYLVPYKNKNVIEAQFQLGYKGYIQLAQRTGLMKTIDACAVYEGDSEQDIMDRLTMFMPPIPKSKNIIGFVAYFEMLNGFSARVSMREHELAQHALEYSQSYKSAEQKGNEWKKKTSPWHQHYETMAKKTVLKLLLSKQAPLSIDSDLTTALQADQAVIRDVNGETQYDYVDNASGQQQEQRQPLVIDITNNPKLFETVKQGVLNGNIDKVALLKGDAGYTISDQQRQEVSTL